MALDTLEIFGTEFTNVTGIKATDDQSGTKVYIRPQGTKSISANGTGIDVAEYASVDVNVSGGGGGASNIVTGTFKGTTTGAAIDVPLNYTGNGYPIAVLVYPKEGPYNSNTGSFYSLVQRYAINFWLSILSAVDTAPIYDGSSTGAMGYVRWKNSTTTPTTYGGTSIADNKGVYNNSSATTSSSTGGAANNLHIKSKTELSVYIASSTYGFAANIEYKYWVLYSS